VPAIPGGRALVDPDTPAWALSKSSWFGRGEMELVFSDEFNTEGRTFYPGDDPYWEAVDLWYWPTGDREWYDPSAITTSGGSLTITFTDTPSHGMNYTSGMMQTWNKFCFTGGLIEASVMMPGWSNLLGMWPALWTMGNLGRAGYGATTDGLVRTTGAYLAADR
jgi:beta-glucanase (GH16 family)